MKLNFDKLVEDFNDKVCAGLCMSCKEAFGAISSSDHIKLPKIAIEKNFCTLLAEVKYSISFSVSSTA